jgi:CheY-like chemotaxis protein
MAPPLPDNRGGSPVVMPTLLLVEDARIIALDLARRLTKLGYTVLAIAGSGREAVQQAVDLRPDLVLMDVG